MTACASRCSSACLLRQIIIVKKMRGTVVVPLDKSGHISLLMDRSIIKWVISASQKYERFIEKSAHLKRHSDQLIRLRRA
jgi:hypothetical protein